MHHRVWTQWVRTDMPIHVYAGLLQVIHILPCTGHLYYAIDRIKRMETFRQTVVTGFCKYEKRVTIMRIACSSAVVTPGKRSCIHHHFQHFQPKGTNICCTKRTQKTRGMTRTKRMPRGMTARRNITTRRRQVKTITTRLRQVHRVWVWESHKILACAFGKCGLFAR